MRRLALACALLAGCGESGPPRSAVVARGKDFQPEDYLQAGYVTVLTFTADW